MSAVELRVAQRRGTVALAGRETRRVLSLWTQTILPPALTAALFLAVFGGALGSRIRDLEGLSYSSFILPGLLVMTGVSTAFANASTSLFQAKNEGYVDDLLSAPLRAWQLAAGYLAGAVVRSIAAVALVFASAAPFARVGHAPLVAFAALALAMLVFASLGIVTGVWAETFDQHAFIASIVITPLALVGGVFYSARTLEEPWSTLTRLDPLFYLVDAARAGLTGVHESPVWLSLSVTAIVAGASFALAASLIARGWRLKP